MKIAQLGRMLRLLGRKVWVVELAEDGAVGREFFINFWEGCAFSQKECSGKRPFLIIWIWRGMCCFLSPAAGCS